MAPASSRTAKSDTGNFRHRHDTRFRDSDPKSAGKKTKRIAENSKALPPGLREEEDDEDWPPKYKKAAAPPKVPKVAARHPRTGRKQWDPTPSAPRPKTDLRISPERAIDVYDEGWRNTTEGDPVVYERRMRMFYEQLKKDREFSRKKMIQNGLLADPDKPTTLENAITIVGTCQDMCPLHERVERIVQQMVDKCEKVVHPATGEDVPFEDYMVKRFRRSAAGDDEQLPSDIRPPLVLQKTLNYLLEEVINGPEALSKVHKFVWDRTRAIRNDFSIQQVTKPDDVRIAMDCFERIARFHILALHQLSLPENVENSDFDAHQELEQLVKTLLSLTYYYDDNRGIVTSPNEAEFRAYTIIIEIENPRPRLEQRAGTWPKHVLEDQQVQMALSLYAMCGGIEDGKGNWFAGTSFELAPGNPRSFFPFLKSPKVPYLLACVTEISFYYIRGLILESICEEFKDGMANSQERKNWSAEDVQAILGFDDVDQTSGFCLSHGLPMKFIKDKTNLDLDRGEFKREHRRSRPQVFSKKIVEDKRAFRTYLEITNGLWAPQEGIEEALDDLEASVRESYEPLFVSDDSDGGEMDNSPAQDATRHTSFPTVAELTSTPNSSHGFAKPNGLPNTSSFGKPTPVPLPQFQNQENSIASQLSTSSEKPDDQRKPNFSTVGVAAGEKRNPFSQAPSNDSPNPPKQKLRFSAPPGQWQFPKGVIDTYATNIASPASSSSKVSEVSPQTFSENTTAQSLPFESSNFSKTPSFKSFSQTAGSTSTQLAPSANSNPFQTAPRDLSSGDSSGDTNAQPAPTGYLDSSKSASLSPFSVVSYEHANPAGSASSQPLPLSNTPQPSSGRVSQNSANNTPAWPAASPFYGSFNLFYFNNPAGISALPTWEMLSSFQRSSIQARPTNCPPVFAASPFSGSFNGVNFSNAPAAALLPTWTTSLTTQNTPVVTSNPQKVSWPVSSAPQSFSFVTSPLPSPDQLKAASLPTSTASSNFLNVPGLANSFATTSSLAISPPGALSTNKPSTSSGSPTQMRFLFSDPTKKPDLNSLTTPPPTSNLSSKLSFDVSKPLSSVSGPTTSSSPLLNTPPSSSGEAEQSPFDTAKPLSPSLNTTISPSPLLSTPPLSSDAPEKSPSVLEKAPLLFNQQESSASRLQNTPTLSTQPDISPSTVKNATWTSAKLETPSILNNAALSSTPPSIPPLLNYALMKPKALTPTAEETPASPKPNMQSPNTTILTEETSKTPAVVLTSPIEEEDSKTAPKAVTDVSSIPSGSTNFPTSNKPKRASAPKWFLVDKRSTSLPVSLATNSPPPRASIAQETLQAEAGSHRSDRRSETRDVHSNGLVLDKDGFMEEFVDFQVSKTVEDRHSQLEDQRLRKEAQEYRVMALSKKYIGMWRATAWKKGLMRRAPERRRRFAESLQQMARDTARHKENLMASLSRRKSGNKDRQSEIEVSSTESALAHSSSSKKRKSSEIEDDFTSDRMSRRIKAVHDGSTTAGKPKVSETEELINTLIATRDDYSYLADGSESSYKILQKIRTLLPPVKLDDTRSDYFMLKSRGIDPDTPIVPRTSRKRHSSDEILSSPNKRVRESPQTKSASALSASSSHPRSEPPSSPLKKPENKYGDGPVNPRSADFDEKENELLVAQRELDSKMTGVIRRYKEQRAKWGSGSISTSSVAPNRSIEYYKEQRAKWGTQAAKNVINSRPFTPTRSEEVLRASGRYGGQSMGFKQDTKAAIRAVMEQRQRDWYATMQPGFETERGIPHPASLAAAVTTAGSSAEAAIEL